MNAWLASYSNEQLFFWAFFKLCTQLFNLESVNVICFNIWNEKATTLLENEVETKITDILTCKHINIFLLSIF